MTESYAPRRIDSNAQWCDDDGIKIYTVSASGRPVDQADYTSRLAQIKQEHDVDWRSTPAFAIFHDGAGGLQYLVLAWWGNDNELFTTVTVRDGERWIVDPARYSFCVWDLEIFWAERNFFIEHVYTERPDQEAYRRARLSLADTGHE